jgi:hypothetical protein
MAVTSIKSTYSLDVETVAALERMARRWNVPKSEALRRAIHRASEEDGDVPLTPVQALEALQRACA